VAPDAEVKVWLTAAPLPRPRVDVQQQQAPGRGVADELDLADAVIAQRLQHPYARVGDLGVPAGVGQARRPEVRRPLLELAPGEDPAGRAARGQVGRDRPEAPRLGADKALSDERQAVRRRRRAALDEGGGGVDHEDLGVERAVEAAAVVGLEHARVVDLGRDLLR